MGLDTGFEFRVRIEYDLDPIDSREDMEDPDDETIQYYLNGEVYGYIIEQRPINTEWEHVWKECCSCWGFYGPDSEKNGMSWYVEEFQG